MAVTPIEAIWQLPGLGTIEQELSNYETDGIQCAGTYDWHCPTFVAGCHTGNNCRATESVTCPTIRPHCKTMKDTNKAF